MANYAGQDVLLLCTYHLRVRHPEGVFSIIGLLCDKVMHLHKNKLVSPANTGDHNAVGIAENTRALGGTASSQSGAKNPQIIDRPPFCGIFNDVN